MIMKQHPLTGENICKPLKSLRLVLPIIRHHHEHMDGSGYPDGLAEAKFRCCRGFCRWWTSTMRLRTARPYKPAIGHDQSVQTMREKAHQGLLDGDLVNEFFGMLLEQRRRGVSGQVSALAVSSQFPRNRLDPTYNGEANFAATGLKKVTS